MSVIVTTVVSCDGCHQDSVGLVGPSVNRPGARAEARRSGWTHHKGKDYCPDCAEALAVAR